MIVILSMRGEKMRKAIFRAARELISLRYAICTIVVVMGCSRPTSPPSSTTLSSNQVVINGPKSGLAGLPFRFSAHLNFIPAEVVMYKWSFDSSTITQYDSSISWTFNSTAQHILRVIVLRADDSVVLCSAIDTFNSTFNGMTITPDSLQASLLTLYTFTANLNPLRTYVNYELVWTIDNVRTFRFNSDTISWIFSQIGKHYVQVVREDTTTGAVIETASTIATIAPIQFVVLAVPTSSLVFSPMNFILNHPSPLPKGTRVSWDFGDGVSYDTTAESVTHAYGFTGNMTVRVSLKEGVNVVGIDSTVVQISPILNGYNPSLLGNFQHIVVTFVGDNQFAGATDGDCPFGGSTLSQSEGIAFQDSNATGSGLTANFSKDAMLCLSLSFGSSDGGSQLDSCSPPYGVPTAGVTWNWSQSLSFSKLSLVFFTPDSVGYAVEGPSTQSHVSWRANCYQTFTDCSGGSQEYGEAYTGTNWNSSPNATAIVTLYK
jgi:hypothetical protein